MSTPRALGDDAVGVASTSASVLIGGDLRGGVGGEEGGDVGERIHWRLSGGGGSGRELSKASRTRLVF